MATTNSLRDFATTALDYAKFFESTDKEAARLRQFDIQMADLRAHNKRADDTAALRADTNRLLGDSTIATAEQLRAITDTESKRVAILAPGTMALTQADAELKLAKLNLNRGVLDVLNGKPFSEVSASYNLPPDYLYGGVVNAATGFAANGNVKGANDAMAKINSTDKFAPERNHIVRLGFDEGGNVMSRVVVNPVNGTTNPAGPLGTDALGNLAPLTTARLNAAPGTASSVPGSVTNGWITQPELPFPDPNAPPVPGVTATVDWNNLARRYPAPTGATAAPTVTTPPPAVIPDSGPTVQPPGRVLPPRIVAPAAAAPLDLNGQINDMFDQVKSAQAANNPNAFRLSAQLDGLIALRQQNRISTQAAANSVFNDRNAKADGLVANYNAALKRNDFASANAIDTELEQLRKQMRLDRGFQ